MIAAPVTGWIIVSTSKIKVETLLFGSVPWPHLPVPASWGEPAEFLHHFMPNVAIALLVLHVAGALRHQYLLGTPILARMLRARLSRAALDAAFGQMPVEVGPAPYFEATIPPT